jgi:hypothetical protein
MRRRRASLARGWKSKSLESVVGCTSERVSAALKVTHFGETLWTSYARRAKAIGFCAAVGVRRRMRGAIGTWERGSGDGLAGSGAIPALGMFIPLAMKLDCALGEGRLFSARRILVLITT